MTNPSRTPLFAHASGPVTDMGGILSHGSIVARECGIPAVVETSTSTQRIKHGQQITVDGDVGTVKLLDDEQQERRPALGTERIGDDSKPTRT